MSVWGELALGVIALATLTTAVMQVAVLVVASRLVRRLDLLANKVERELTPMFGHLNAIGREAARAAALATAQIERADAMFADLTRRVELTLGSMQSTLSLPAREGRALLEGFRAALDALRHAKRSRPRGEEEDALFI